MPVTRRALIAAASAALLAPRLARAATVTDDAGRARAGAAPKCSACFRPGRRPRSCSTRSRPTLLLGWPRANRPEECAYMLPDICARPEIGRITGRGNTANLETVIALKPDLILDVGSTSATLCLARRTRAAADRHSLCAARRPLPGAVDRPTESSAN